MKHLLYQGSFSGTHFTCEQLKKENAVYLHLNASGKNFTLLLYQKNSETAQVKPFFGKFTLNEILRSGRDILSEEALKHGEPSRAILEGALPKIGKNGYAHLGSVASWSGYTFTREGECYLQTTGGANDSFILFHPAQLDTSLGTITPEIHLLNYELPIVVCVHFGENEILQIIHAIEPQDSDRNPTLWTWAQWKNRSDDSITKEAYLRSSYSRHIVHRPVNADEFWYVLLNSVFFWEQRFLNWAKFDLPDKTLQTSIHAMLAMGETTFSADHPHYGHKFYGQETHDYFPPTLLSYAEAAYLFGDLKKARGILSHVLSYGFDAFGRYAYRQGEEEVHGASASEYGQLFCLIEKTEAEIKPRGWLKEHLSVLEKAGHYLLSQIESSELNPECKLISMCAEADTNNRIHTYAQNNLWASRGLTALGNLFARYGLKSSNEFLCAGEMLKTDTLRAFEKESVLTPYGEMIPFRLGYSPIPHTLSGCRDTYAPLTEEEYAKYAGRVSWCRNDHENEKEQDFTENCYANYRYYPEMLSSGLLKKEHAEAIYRYRQNFGGEILGMTRLFKDAIDDWPVSHMARYLLESGYKDQYLLLFFAHLCHHGEEKTGVYYEQRALGGQWVAPDCVPSLMTIPLMLGWMFVYESIGGKELSLLKGVPKAWFKTGFKAEGLYSRYGRIDIHLQIKNDKRLLHICLPQLPKDSSVRLYTDNAECIPLQNQRKIDIEL